MRYTHTYLLGLFPARQLAKDLSHATSMLKLKKDALRNLSLTFEDRIAGWIPMDRRPVDDGSDVKSVYRMSGSKGGWKGRM